MKRNWILRAFMAGCASGLLFGTVALGQAETKTQSGDVARGKTLFVRHCTGCHGPEGGGDGYKFLSGPDPAKLTSPSTRKKSEADLLKAIHDGKPNMPPWNVRFSKEESRDVRTLAK